MELIRKKSKNSNDKGLPFTDLILTWEFEGRLFHVKIKPSFPCDYRLLLAVSKDTKPEE